MTASNMQKSRTARTQSVALATLFTALVAGPLSATPPNTPSDASSQSAMDRFLQTLPLHSAPAAAPAPASTADTAKTSDTADSSNAQTAVQQTAQRENRDNKAADTSTTAAHPPAFGNLPSASAANAVLIRAISLVGTPYRWGGNTPESGFDCSGLVNFVFGDMLNLKLPRTSHEIAHWQGGVRIANQQLSTGDLVFFAHSGTTVNHVGIYVGDGRFVHAPSAGGTVRLERLDSNYWQRRYTGARRVL